MASSKYTKAQLRILADDDLLMSAHGNCLKSLFRKAQENGDNELIAKIERITTQKSLTKQHMAETKKFEYSEMHLDIIDGKIPMESANTHALLGVLSKAKLRGDDNIILLVEKELKRRRANPRSSANRVASSEYNAWQQQVIDGDIPLIGLSGPALSSFLKKAKLKEDSFWVEQIEQEWARQKKESRLKTNEQRNRRRNSARYGEDRHWRPPKTREYTKQQKDIINGIVPLCQVHTNALISIHEKAKLHGELELAERIYDVIASRNVAVMAKEARQRRIRRGVTAAGQGDEELDNLTVEERELIFGMANWEDYTEREIELIINKLEMLGKGQSATIARLILRYKKDESLLYAESDHDKAIDLIEALLGLPVRRPNVMPKTKK